MQLPTKNGVVMEWGLCSKCLSASYLEKIDPLDHDTHSTLLSVTSVKVSVGLTSGQSKEFVASPVLRGRP